MARPTRLSAWRVGQLLAAVVVERAGEGHVWLDIDGLAMQAQAPADLPVGVRLRLRVKSLGARVMLEIVGQDSADAAPVRAAIRGLLPRQGKLTPLLANLTFLTATADGAPSSLPFELTAAASELLTSVPHAARLGFADALQAALDDSGIFLEARLARAAQGGPAPAIAYDFKGALLRFLQALGTTQNGTAMQAEASPAARESADYPPLRHAPLRAQPRAMASLAGAMHDSSAISHLKGQLDEALARLHVMQLSAHPADSGGASWLFELPMRHDGGIDLWQLRLEREPDDGGGGERTPVWTAMLSFELGDLGPVHARVSVRGPKVSTLFWAERAATADLYSRALNELAALYQAHGLSIGALACHVGEPHAAAPQRSGLLDLRA